MSGCRAGKLGSVTTKPQVTDGRVALQVVDVTGLGLLLPREMVQSALAAFTTHLTENYPLGIHADRVAITYDGVTAHFSTRDTSIPQGNQGNQGNKDHQDPASQSYRPASMARRGEGGECLRDRMDTGRSAPAGRSSEIVVGPLWGRRVCGKIGCGRSPSISRPWRARGVNRTDANSELRFHRSPLRIFGSEQCHWDL